MKEKIIVIIVAIVLILGIGIGGMQLLANLKEKPEKPKKKIVKRYVKTQKVEYSVTSSSIEASGRIESQHYFDLSSEVQGKILSGSVPLKKGQTFTRGALLAKVYNAEAKLILKARKSRFLNSIANLLPDFKVDFNESYDDWLKFLESIDLNKNLAEIPKIRTKQEKIYLASKNILSDYYTIKSEELRLQKYYIRAPFSGTFNEVFLQTGSIANPGSRIAKIIRTDKLELEVPIEAFNSVWINIGDKVDISTESSEAKWEGTVLRKSNFIDPQTQSITIFVSIKPSSKYPLYKGLYLIAEFSGVSIKNSMEIPRNAVFNNNEVFVVKDSLLRVKQINIHKYNQKTLIFSGLEKSSQLVTQPLINAFEGTKVHIMK